MAPDGGPRPRVAVACQGGGSHTAFTAGVLRGILRRDLADLVAFSGTSGGAICGLLAWYGLLSGGPDDAARRLERFWRDNAASDLWDSAVNAWLVGLARLDDVLSLPQLTPYNYPPVAAQRLTSLLTAAVDFDRVQRLSREPGPILLVGAVDVLSGQHHLFDSRKGEISAQAILASAAIPNLFRAVPIGDGLYWDGVFARNPPVRELPETDPDEIWVVQINPTRRAREPRTVSEILDRRNELSGNLSLEQELHFLSRMNELLDEGSLQGERYRRIEVHRIALEHDLDLASKLDRSPRLISSLMAAGERAAASFLAARFPAAT